MNIKNLLLSLFTFFCLIFNSSLLAQFTEDFEVSGNTAPANWTVTNLGIPEGWLFGSVSLSSAHSGSSYAYIGNTTGSLGCYLISPQINVNAQTSDLLELFAKRTSNGWNSFSVLVSTTGNLTSDFVDFLQEDVIPSTIWVKHTFDLSAYIGQDIYIAIHGMPRINTNNKLLIDDIEIKNAPFCPKPSDLTAFNITSVTADIMWVESGTATQWNIEYGESGFLRGGGAGTLASVSNNPIHSVSIQPNTKYDFYVQTVCSGSDSSLWVGPYSFTNFYCLPVYSSGMDYIELVETSGAIIDFSYSSIAQPVDGYSDETSVDFQVYESDSFDINLTYFSGDPSTNNVFKIWVDWNHNYYFDTNELVLYEDSYQLSNDHTITIPSGTPAGDYRMRIKADYGGFSGSPCSNSTWGSYIDLTLTVVTPPCDAPSGLNAANITMNTADLEWIESGTSSEWNVEFGVAGFIQGAGTTINNVTDNPFVLTGLMSNSNYEFYVQSVCGTNQSPWEGPISFTTLQGPSQILIMNIGSNSAEISWVDNSAATDWSIEYGVSGFNLGTGTEITTTVNPYTISGLASNTDYDVYIWANFNFHAPLIVLGPYTFSTQSCDLILMENISVCKNEFIVLETLLNAGVDQGGTWLNPSDFPITSSEIIMSNVPGAYEYTYLPTLGSGCFSDTGYVTIVVDSECDYLTVSKNGIEDLSVFPNPTTNNLNIVNPSNTSSLKIEMLDMNGRIVLVENKALTNAKEASVRIEHLESGVYTLRVFNSKGQKSFKVVKQ